MPEDPLASLKDIHLPEPTSWWPPAPGWWLLLLFVLLSPWLWRIVQGYLRRTPPPEYRPAALRELDQHYHQYQQRQDGPAFVQAVSALLKRVAMQCYNPAQVASLSGAQWAEFLGRNQGREQQQTIERVFSQVHSNKLQLDAAELYRFARDWIQAQEEF